MQKESAPLIHHKQQFKEQPMLALWAHPYRKTIYNISGVYEKIISIQMQLDRSYKVN